MEQSIEESDVTEVIQFNDDTALEELPRGITISGVEDRVFIQKKNEFIIKKISGLLHHNRHV